MRVHPIISQQYITDTLRGFGPWLLKPEWRRTWRTDRPTTGYCYLVSEALYHYTVPDTQPFVVNLGDAGTHWFLRDIATGRIIDYTGDQFDFPVPYDRGRRCAFFRGAVTAPRGLISKRGFSMEKLLKVA